MEIVRREWNGKPYALLQSDGVCIQDAQSALDCMVTAQYAVECEGLAVPKEALCEAFFSLRTGLAGDILQKFVNYHMKLAIIGDFSQYQSQPLQDFIWESNQGNAIFFVGDEQEAARRLCGG